MMTEEMPDRIYWSKQWRNIFGFAPFAGAESYTRTDLIQPLVEALEAAVIDAEHTVAAVHGNVVWLDDARQALERFKGMNTLAPSKTD